MQEDSFNETQQVASATECTGIMPALPVEEPVPGENAAQLYAIHPPKKNGRKRYAKGKKRN